MKSLALSEEQRTKLIEMCNHLFPKFGEVQLLQGHIAAIQDETNSPYLRWYLKENNTIKLVEIHWFEFCLTYLAEKVLNPRKPFRSQKELFCDFFWETNIAWYYSQHGSLPVSNFVDGARHPVDYLYKEFQKLHKKTNHGYNQRQHTDQ